MMNESEERENFETVSGNRHFARIHLAERRKGRKARAVYIE